MTNEELIDIIQNRTDNSAAMAALYEQNTGLLRAACAPYRYYAEIDDLMQESYFALMNAARSYDSSRGVKFTSYAVKAIQRHCVRYIQNTGNIKRIPANMLERISKYTELRREMNAVRHREPTKEEAMYCLRLNEKQYSALILAITESGTRSLDETVKDGSGGETALSELIPDSTNIEEEYIDRECQRELWQQVEALPEMERDIITAHHVRRRSLADIADDIGSTRERVRQTEQKGLRTLRKNSEVKNIGQHYGYGIRQAYHWSLNRFKDTWTSSTEWLALKRLEG